VAGRHSYKVYLRSFLNIVARGGGSGKGWRGGWRHVDPREGEIQVAQNKKGVSTPHLKEKETIVEKKGYFFQWGGGKWMGEKKRVIKVPAQRRYMLHLRRGKKKGDRRRTN